MADYPADLSGNKFSITKPSIYQTLQDFIANYNKEVDDVQSYINDLKDKIDAITSDDSDVAEKIQKLKDIIDKADTELDLVGAIDKIADILNTINLIVRKRVTVNTDNGIVEVDITDLGFSSVDDYEVVATPAATLADGSVNPAVLAVEKVDEKTFKLHAFDRRNFVETNPYYKDGATKDDDGNYTKAFDASIAVIGNKEFINLKISTVDDGETTIGG